MKDDWYDDDDPEPDDGPSNIEQAGRAGFFDTIGAPDDVCDATVTLSDAHGGAFQIGCEESGPHEDHSGTVRWKTAPDPYATRISAQIDRCLERSQQRPDLRVSWRMPQRAADILSTVAPLAVDDGASLFMGLPVVVDNTLDSVELVCDEP